MTYQLKSWLRTTSPLNFLSPQDTRTLKYAEACMASRMQPFLACDQLKDHLAKYGYVPFKQIPSMWHHTTRQLPLAWLFMNLASNISPKNNSNHLLSALQDKYSITTYWSDDYVPTALEKSSSIQLLTFMDHPSVLEENSICHSRSFSFLNKQAKTHV